MPASGEVEAGPLAGFKVLELATYAAGPSAGAVLADWGAEVLKVEPLKGDPFRRLAGIAADAGTEHSTADLDNRGKRSVTIDVTSAEGREIVAELVARADVFLTNMRGQALRKLRLDYETLHPLYPRLVYAWLTGYGPSGPDADLPAFDAGTWWGRAGVALRLLPDDVPPMFHSGAIGDHSTGLALAGGVSAALLARERTGKGQRVDASLLRAGAFFISSDLYAHLIGSEHAKYTRETRPNPLVLPYRSREGKWMMLLGVEPDRVWAALARAIGRPELADDTNYANAAARSARREQVVRILDEAFAKRTRDEWDSIFRREGVWWSPMQEVHELPADPQMRAAGCFVPVSTRWGEREMVPAPVDFSETPWLIRSGSCAAGAHNDEVLADLGRSESEIARLRALKVIG